MCLSRPKMPSQAIAPMAPPPPTPVAEEVEDRNKKRKDTISRRGTSSLTIRRPSVSLPTTGSGANINY